MIEQWQKLCNRHGPYGTPSCQKCQAELNQTMSAIADSIAEQAHAKEQERAMTAPTEQQLNDPKWWDGSVCQSATHYDSYRGKFLKNPHGDWLEYVPGRATPWQFVAAGSVRQDLLVSRPKSKTKPAVPAWLCPTCHDHNQQINDKCLSCGRLKPWNGEGLPPVGCECERQSGSGKWVKVCVLGYHGRFVWLSLEDWIEPMTFFVADSEFRPLRTPEQREREEVVRSAAHVIEMKNGSPISLYLKYCEDLYDAGMLRKGDE